jgi:hypothetical protein
VVHAVSGDDSKDISSMMKESESSGASTAQINSISNEKAKVGSAVAKQGMNNQLPLVLRFSP